MSVSRDETAQPSEETPAAWGGLRMTKQRREVYSILMEERDHPTAQEVFQRAKRRMPTISLATVYNCLEALVGNEVVKQVNFDRAPSRYCPNLEEHVHFQDLSTGKIYDVPFKKGVRLQDLLDLPEGVEICEFDLTLKGSLPATSSPNH